VLLVIAHPAIANGIETLLRLEGEYDLRRVPGPGDIAKLGEWTPDVALIDGTILSGYDEVNVGAPAFVLSGNERDGKRLARKLDDGRGWLRKDATGAELVRTIATVMEAGAPTGGLGALAIAGIVALALVVIALLAYLAYHDAIDRALADLQAELATRCHSGLLGRFGPRYLHSTGQLHKGGPPTGAFLQIVDETAPVDLAIPGKPYSFGTLLAAQALGDLQSLRRRHRRVARITLAQLEEVAGR